jgi:hypothetical protein
MKFIHQDEDSVLGLGIGILLIGLSGNFFSVPKNDTLWAIVLVVSFAFTLFDLRNTFSKMKSLHSGVLLMTLLNNLIDAIFEIGIACYLFRFNAPFISAYLNPYLTQPQSWLYIGLFFLVSSAFWLYETHHRVK